MSRRANIRLRVIARYGRRCHLCERPISKRRKISMDHVIPESKGGKYSIENLRPSHRGCNVRRGNSDLDEFRSMLSAPPFTDVESDD